MQYSLRTLLLVMLVSGPALAGARHLRRIAGDEVLLICVGLLAFVGSVYLNKAILG